MGVRCSEREALRSAGAAWVEEVTSPELEVGHGWSVPLPWSGLNGVAVVGLLASR